MDVQYSTTSAHLVAEAGQFESCSLYKFITTAVLTGSFCLVGFVFNSVTFVVMWQHGSSPLQRMLLLLCAADGLLLWMIFLADVLPSLGYIAYFMHVCHRVCHFVRLVTSPFLFIARVCTGWFTVVAVFIQYVTVCRPAAASRWASIKVGTISAIVITIIAVVCSIPLAVEKNIGIVQTAPNMSHVLIPLTDIAIYRSLYTNALQFLLVYLLPSVAIVLLSVKMALSTRKMNQPETEDEILEGQHGIRMNRVTQSIAIMYVMTSLLPLVDKMLTWISGVPPDYSCSNMEFHTDAFSKLVLSINSSCKFLVYCILMPNFWLLVKQMWHCTSKSGDKPEEFRYQCKDMSEMTLISDTDA